MDFLRRAFGLHPEDDSRKPSDDLSMMGEPETAPLRLDIEDIVDDLKMIPEGVTRRLPDQPYIDNSLQGHFYGIATDVGMVRSNNQDAVASFVRRINTAEDQLNIGFFAVADGMGGHLEGEKASTITIRTIEKMVMEKLVIPIISDDKSEERPTVHEVLIEAAQEANRLVMQDVSDGGTTLTVAIILGDLIHLGHVGDTRAYIITHEHIEKITRDHSLIERLRELNALTPELEASQSNVLYRAIGQSESLEVDTVTRRLPLNSTLLLCSDGLWGMVDDATIRELVMDNPDPQQAADKLVALANTNGGMDNISVIIVKG